jgi:hypothetical protein
MSRKTKGAAVIEPHSYEEDQRPCIVARKPCGCYCAAAGLDEDELLELVEWDIESDLDRPALIEFFKDAALHGATFELRPVSFVRAGGLNFNCEHERKAKSA